MAQADELNRLVNGVLWPGFLGGEVPDWLADALAEGLAGVVYFAQNLDGDTAALSAEIHRLSPRALIGIDEEGGSVTRLETRGGSTVPGAAQLGMLDDTEATRATGREIGHRVDRIGGDVVIGPVADVNTDPRNPVIGVRAFGADTALVSRHVAAAVQGIQDAGVAACAKHYPGHGDTHTDSHHDLPRLTLDQAQIESVHLPPFTAAARAGVHAIMTAHITAPHWGDAPATLNPAVLGALRETGFDGVIVTDALDMAAIRETVGIGEGAVQALAAGADLLCIGNPTNPGEAMLPDQDERDYLAARDAIVAAIREGRLPRERVEDAARRVATMADAVRSRPAAAESPASDVAFDADDIADRALRVDGELGGFRDAPTTVIDLRRPSSLAVDSAAAHVALALAAGGEIVRVDAETASDAAIAAAAERATAEGPASQTVVLVDRADAGAAQRAALDGIRSAIRAGAAPCVVVNVGLPADIDGPVITSAAASLLAARAARRALLRGTDREELRSTLGTLATEGVDPTFADLDLRSTGDQVALMAAQGVVAAQAVAAEQASIARAVDGIVERLHRGGRLVYIGAGTAGRMGVLDASEIPPTFGTDPSLVTGIIAGGEHALRNAVENAEDDIAAGERAGGELGPDDAIVGISASGRTPYVTGALRAARERGAFTVSLACNTGAEISDGVDVAIEVVVGPEVVAGSTRLKAGTAQKLVLNTLSTLAMVQSGKVYGNLMVDVQSTNEKLRARAERTVMHATSCCPAQASDALRVADGSVKLAIAIVETGADADAARAALDAAGGDLRAALRATGGTAD